MIRTGLMLALLALSPCTATPDKEPLRAGGKTRSHKADRFRKKFRRRPARDTTT
jgi:hypothetical protein